MPTNAEIRAWFIERGITVTQWAAQHGFPRGQVYAVLNGRNKGSWGMGHRIAVTLGIKGYENESSKDDVVEAYAEFRDGGGNDAQKNKD